MKVISQDGATATLLFIPDEVKPIKGYHLPELLKAIGEKYGALKIPSVEEARNKEARFENGILIDKSVKISLPALIVHNDGIIASTTDTEDSEFVINDLFIWLQENFGFREPSTPMVRIFQSDLIVQFDNNPEEAFGLIEPFIKFIEQEMTPPNTPTKKPVKFSHIGFGADPTGSGASPEFMIARRLSMPWKLGLYFSKAHMRTKAHIKALELLDDLLGKKG